MNQINLIFGDAFEEMQKLQSCSIDCIITDPPYGINYDHWDVLFDIKKISKEWNRLLKDNGSIFCFCGWSTVTKIITDFDENLKLNDWIIYDRIKGRGTTKRLVSTREDLLWYVKGKEWTFHKELAYSEIKKSWVSNTTKFAGVKSDFRVLTNVWTDIQPIVPWSKERNSHPTQKPLKILKRILTVFTNPNDLILDCYMGSGSTGEACLDLNRNFIGIENNKEYFDMARDRLENNKNYAHSLYK